MSHEVLYKSSGTTLSRCMSQPTGPLLPVQTRVSVTPLDPSTSWVRQAACGPKIWEPLQQSGQYQAPTGQLQAVPSCSGQSACQKGETRQIRFYIEQVCSPAPRDQSQDSGFMPHMPGSKNSATWKTLGLRNHLVTAVLLSNPPELTPAAQARYQCSSRQCMLLAAGQYLCL